MEKKRLDIIGISNSQTQSGAYALILGEVGGKRRLPIIIGGYEAQAIAIELERMKPNRPLTHDLFKNFALSYNITLKEVIINKFAEGIFYAKLICVAQDGIKEIDARTSDAVALAVRFRCYIYTYETVLSAAGIIMDEDTMDEIPNDTPDEDKGNEFDKLNIIELEELLKTAVEKEEYERASKIRDEIQRRKTETG